MASFCEVSAFISVFTTMCVFSCFMHLRKVYLMTNLFIFGQKCSLIHSTALISFCNKELCVLPKLQSSVEIEQSKNYVVIELASQLRLQFMRKQQSDMW